MKTGFREAKLQFPKASAPGKVLYGKITATDPGLCPVDPTPYNLEDKTCKGPLQAAPLPALHI